MTELEALRAELAKNQQHSKEIAARIASIVGTDRPEPKIIKAWLATDKDGEVNIYEDKPFRYNNWFWNIGGGGSIQHIGIVGNNFLPLQVPTWEDESIEVEITIKRV